MGVPAVVPVIRWSTRAMEVSSGGHLRNAMIGLLACEYGGRKRACVAGIRPAMQRTEPTMTKQKKTIAKPTRTATKAGKRPVEPATAPKTKLGQLVGMLRRTEGATIAQIAKALDWQLHSVRGAI